MNSFALGLGEALAAGGVIGYMNYQGWAGIAMVLAVPVGFVLVFLNRAQSVSNVSI